MSTQGAAEQRRKVLLIDQVRFAAHDCPSLENGDHRMASTPLEPGAKIWTLSPSDFAFLWDECKRCFYLKNVRNFRRPATPFPAVFSKIAGMQKTFFDGRPTQELVPALPLGRFAYGERKVVSKPIMGPDRTGAVVIRGRFDVAVEFEGGGYGVIDFKTSTPKDANVAKYGRQLHSYAYALENPSPAALGLAPVSMLGLLCLDPAAIVHGRSGKKFYLQCQPVWVECARDDVGFLAFVEEMLGVLGLPEPPPASPTCSFCGYRERARASGV